MRNILDLRKKPEPEIQIVEKIVIEKRVWWMETLKIVGVLAITIGVTWSLSSANLFIQSDSEEESDDGGDFKQNLSRFTTKGTVSDISETSITLTDATSARIKDKTEFTFDISNAVIWNRSRESVSFSDILVGEKVVVFGGMKGGEISAERVYAYENKQQSPEIIPEVIPEEIPLEEVIEEIIPEVLPESEVLGEETDETSEQPADAPVEEPADAPAEETPPSDPAPEEETVIEEEVLPADEPVDEVTEEETTPTPEEEQPADAPSDETSPSEEPEATLPKDEPVVEDTAPDVPPEE